jgi:hypothetical protein
MKKTSFRLLLAMGCVLLTLMLASCPTDHPSAGFTLSGSFMKSGITDGRFAYTKLVAQGGAPTDATLYWTRSAAFSAGEATYSIANIQQATYTQHSFIDTDNDAAGDATSFPDSTDWVVSGDVTMDSDQIEVYLEGSWTQVP